MESNQKTLNQWTRKEFKELPRRKWNEDIGEFDSLVIFPERHGHDSGYSCMSFIAVKGKTPICLLAGGSDVLHIDGIGGYGQRCGEGGVPETIFPKG